MKEYIYERTGFIYLLKKSLYRYPTHVLLFENIVRLIFEFNRLLNYFLNCLSIKTNSSQHILTIQFLYT